MTSTEHKDKGSAGLLGAASMGTGSPVEFLRKGLEGNMLRAG
ncbi:hypothetical protein Poly30_45440 [Planctomycetes bacterium Poly30]|uniref:Uncharacterized protein n=1 Tax=Saltatorellus ferox TaxID=2528018 RepID=A0A518EY33_9BACT|nr:hypothetical protein Poly30_45440 [Planctomycetes bacterium Poly30]